MGQFRAALRAKARRRHVDRQKRFAKAASIMSKFIRSRLEAMSFMERLFPVVSIELDGAQDIPEYEENPCGVCPHWQHLIINRGQCRHPDVKAGHLLYGLPIYEENKPPQDCPLKGK